MGGPVPCGQAWMHLPLVEEGGERSCSIWSGVEAPPTSRGGRWEVLFHVVRRGCSFHWTQAVYRNVQEQMVIEYREGAGKRIFIYISDYLLPWRSSRMPHTTTHNIQPIRTSSVSIHSSMTRIPANLTQSHVQVSIQNS